MSDPSTPSTPDPIAPVLPSSAHWPALTSAELRRLSLVTYEDGMRMQALMVELKQEERLANQLLVLSHPHVFTLGRRAKAEHILANDALRRAWDVQVYESIRGGDVTYHGPGQLVLYPILALPPARQDVGKYVRDLEEVMIRTVADYGIEAGRIAGLSGTWVGGNKIGAIGVRMARWVTSHGLALNVNTDLRYFDLIVPCGIRDHGVTSLQTLLGRPLDLEEVAARLTHHFSEVFEVTLETRGLNLRSIQSVVYRRGAAGIEVLVLRRVPAKGGFWQPVTGRIEPGETPSKAALREVTEETGLSGTLTDLHFVHQFMIEPTLLGAHAPKPYLCEEHSFAVEVPADASVQLEADSHDAFEWLPLAEAAARVRWSGNRDGILKLDRLLHPPEPVTFDPFGLDAFAGLHAGDVHE